MNIITADQIQQGDRIKVTQTVVDADRTVTYTYEGVAAHTDRSFNGKPVWRTESRENLWAHEENTVIELLDRPKPKIVLPTGEHAVIQYSRSIFLWTGRFNGKNWKLKHDTGEFTHTFSVEELTDMLNEADSMFPRTDYKVLFEGVAK